MKISVSFKSNKLEQEIFDHIMSKMNYSVYLKELVLADMRRNGQTEPTTTKATTVINNDTSMQIEW